MAKLHEYRGDGLRVTYDVKRCIHAEECVHGLPAVFDPARRPWIDPAGGSADEIAEIVLRCPTGALHYERNDGGADERPPSENTARVAADGPLYVVGDLEIRCGEETLRETRAALCRCGASKNKPFCDNSHLEIGFRDPGALGPGRLVPLEEVRGTGDFERRGVTLTAAPNGPLLVAGPLTVASADRAEARSGVKGALCRCGTSKKKPYCDGSHKQMASESEWGK